MKGIYIVLVVLLSGCAAPIQATRDLPQPRTLDEVNALLDGKRVTIELADGTRVAWARDAIVSASELRFTIPAPGPAPGRVPRSLDVRDVARVTYVRNRGSTWGARIGAAPGLLGIASGGLLIVSASRSDSDSAWIGGVVGMFGVASGAALALVGAGLGSAVGSHVSPGGVVTLYEAPVERYLPAADGVAPFAPAAR